MRIVHLIQRFPPAIGGAENWCAGVIRQLTTRGHTVEVLAFRLVDENALWTETETLGPTAVGAVDLYPGVRIRRYAPGRTPKWLVRAFRRAGAEMVGRYSAQLFGRAVAAARTADVVHLHHHTVPLSFWGLVAARMTGRPAVITPHFHVGDWFNEQPIAWWLLRQCDVVIAVSRREAEMLVRNGIEPARVVTATNAVDAPPDPVELERMRTEARARWELDPETKVVTFIGRKKAGKDISVLVDAASAVAEKRPLVLVLMGPGTDDTTGIRPADRPATLRIVDIPAVPEDTKRAVLAASDVVVQPSWREAFGIVFLEAWAARVPVIGAAWGPIPEVLGDAGLTFSRGDHADLAAQLQWMLAHPTEARAMAQRGHARVQRDHTWERVATAVEEAYTRARQSRSRRGRPPGLPTPAKRMVDSASA
jgi:glycosyltransferase involved in cell wall biosynthesis